MNDSAKLQCIYCSLEYFKEGEGSKEHVILSALGGRKYSKNICCVTCNTKYGNEIDREFSKTYQEFSTMIGIKTGRNKDAPTIKMAGQIGDRSFDVLPKGEIKYSSPQVEVKKDGSILNIDISSRSKEEFINILSSIYKSHGVEPSEIKEIKAKSVLTKSPKISSSFHFGGDEHYRAVAKMLLNYLATIISPRRLRSGIFDNCINYIKGEDNIHPIWIDTSTEDDYPKISNINHRIFIFCSSSKKVVYGVLEIFGHIKYAGILTTSWDGADISKCYIIDPVTQESANYDITEKSNIPTKIIDRRSLIDKIDFLTQQFTNIIRIFEERQYQAIQDKMLNIVMDKYNISDNGQVELEIAKKALNEYIDRLNCIYFGTTFEEELTFKNPFDK